MSSSSYIAYHFDVEPLQPASDILIAELGEVGFESFVELDEGLTAYVQKTTGRLTKKTYSQKVQLVIGMLVLVLIRTFIVTLFSK